MENYDNCYDHNMAIQATKITPCGFRTVLERMMKNAQKKPTTNVLNVSSSLFLIREDGHMLAVSIEDQTHIHRHYSTAPSENTFEIMVKWFETPGGEGDDMHLDKTPFVTALTRHLEEEAPCMTLDIVRSDLKSLLHPDECCVQKCFEKLTHLMALRLCECEAAMVDENEMICWSCMVGLEEKDMGTHMCGVCHEQCPAPIHRTPCCGQWIHCACHRKCGSVCPFCRHDGVTVAAAR